MQCKINENSILLINFNNTLNENKSIIYPESEDEAQYARYYINKSKGMNTGAIVAIILATLVAFASLVTIFIRLGKNPIKNEDIEFTTFKFN